MPGAPLPPLEADAGRLWGALDAQTARLDTANGHTADVLEIVTRCETAKQPPKRPWWKLW